MEEEEANRKLKEIEERKKVLASGKKEFDKTEKMLESEEKEINKEIKTRQSLKKEEEKIGAMESKWRSFSGADSGSRIASYIICALAVIIILAVAIYLRTTMLKYWGFYEPDDFYHFSVIRAAVNNNFFIPKNQTLSGWPVSTYITEPKGLYWVTLLPYFFLRFVGISYYNVMRYISVVFGLLDILGAYLLARLFSKDKFFLLLVIALVAMSSGDAARTSALIYRGDGFITIFLILSLLFFAYVFKSKSSREKAIFAILSGIALGIGNFVWNGAPFVTLIYIGSLLLVMTVAFVNKREEMLDNSAYILLSLMIWFILVQLLILGGQIWPGSQALTSSRFLVVYVLIALVWLALRYILKKGYIQGTAQRLVLLVGVIVIGSAVLYISEPVLVTNILINNGLIVTTSFSATIQELTPPTYNFLFASFGYALYSSPVAILMMLPAVLLHGIAATSMLRTELDLLFWFIMFLGFIPYLFMKVYDSGGFMKGNARLRFGIDVPMIILIVYFALTAFLQIYAIRFNSLIAVPLAIFGAYTIYWLILYSKQFEITKLAGALAVFLVTFFLSAMIMQSRLGQSLTYDVIGFIIAALLSYGTYQLMGSSHKYEIAGYVVVAMFLITVFSFDVLYSANVSPADSMNPQLYGALAWLKNNSAQNSVVLTLWPDGSVVEGVANRTSVMDSVGSQNTQKSDLFANWLFNASSDPQFITGSLMGRPNYLLVRYVWLLGETVGIFQESGLNISVENNYAFAPLTSFSEGENATQKTLQFSNGQAGSSAIDVVTQIRDNNSIVSYINEGNGRISPFTYVAFSNVNTGNYSIVRQSAFNQTNNQMLLVQYSDIANPQLQPGEINITNAMILTPGAAQSNMVKFLYFCSSSSCLWNNNVASLKLVYANADTKIFQISYNSST